MSNSFRLFLFSVPARLSRLACSFSPLLGASGRLEKLPARKPARNPASLKKSESHDKVRVTRFSGIHFNAVQPSLSVLTNSEKDIFCEKLK
jgi:hypothetical protein